MSLRNIPHLLAATVVESGHGGRHPVEEELQHPVKHLDQEGELLQNARMNVARETRRVGRPNGPYSKDSTGFGRVVGIERSAERLVAIE